MLPEVLGEGSAWFTAIVMVITMVAGTALIMWMGELITQRGIGNGMSSSSSPTLSPVSLVLSVRHGVLEM